MAEPGDAPRGGLEVRVRLFGAFRRYGPGEVTLVVPRGTPVRAVRLHLAEALRARCPDFAEDALLEASVLADERSVLDDADRVTGGADGVVSLAILPPVCGG